MVDLIRRKDAGQAWNTEADSGIGGSAGVWKDFGVDSVNDCLIGLTIGDGTIVQRWWTPSAVVDDPSTIPFLLMIYFAFVFGSTSAVSAPLEPTLPQLVDGGVNDIVPVISGGTPGSAIGIIAGNPYAGLLGSQGTPIQSGDTTPWDATNPAAWSQGDTLAFTSIFQAKFVPD